MDHPGGPLTAAEVDELDATLLPALERHHLRLLAHGLRSLQEAAGRRHGPLPDPRDLASWALRQPQVAAASDFADAFTAQLQKLGDELAAIAAALGRDPLGLTLAELTDWARSQADRRIDAHRRGD
ncbi:hypothetical protein [Cyanobium sp. CH-040]|uniref:hypothetical protein n=1 Tax=Cyanobium sp. CH-040 TaxID=2823708 RepID=UPI0020CC8CB7|nr:hypothetical protein [Cyanobium sp. CH-040]MCP9927265.1 hypothetical protein [Cyanobium sp. CH-040]